VHLGPTWRTPGRPEIEQHDLGAKISKPPDLSFQVGHGEIGRENCAAGRGRCISGWASQEEALALKDDKRHHCHHYYNGEAVLSPKFFEKPGHSE